MLDTRKVIESMADMIINTSISFRTHSPELLSKIKRDNVMLEQMIKSIKDQRAADYIETARQSFERLLAAVESKVTGRVLFSATAAGELEKIFGGLVAYLGHLGDYLLTGNTVLQRHIKDESAKYDRLAREFATKHEERLIQGICQPRSSSIYLDMLTGISGIFYHLSRLAE